MSSNVVKSLRISSIIPLSLSSWMTCSVNNLSYSLYWHSAALGLSLLIHSCVDSLFCLCNLLYWRDIIILLCYGLNLLHNTVKRPFTLIHFSFSSLMLVWISCRPSWPNHFFITGTFSSPESSYVLCWKYYKILIQSKLIKLLLCFSILE